MSRPVADLLAGPRGPQEGVTSSPDADRSPRRQRRTTVALLPLAGMLALAAGVTPSDLPGQETHVVLVVGLGGAPEYREQFHDWALDLRSAALDGHGVAPERLVYLGERPDMAPGVIDARSTRDELAATLTRMGSEAGPDDRVLLVLIGHGTSRNDEASFNLPGPDLTATDLATLLDEAFSGPTVAVVNTTPSSGPFVEALSGPDRIVLTATKTARERNETVFGRYFAEAFLGETADLDKDGRVSLLEAFVYARSEVARWYEEEKLLLTEHALLDDDGDGEGSEAPGLEPGAADGDGALARSFSLGPPTTGAATATEGVPDDVTDPAVRELYRERVAIQGRIDALRARKTELAETEYEDRLEELLIELALKNREIRAVEGGGS